MSILNMFWKSNSIFFCMPISIRVRATTWRNQQNDLCAQQRLRSAWASAQSDQSLRCALWTQAFFMQTAKTDQTGQMPRLIRVFTGRTSYFVGFVMRRLIYKKMRSYLPKNNWILSIYLVLTELSAEYLITQRQIMWSDILRSWWKVLY